MCMSLINVSPECVNVVQTLEVYNWEKLHFPGPIHLTMQLALKS